MAVMKETKLPTVVWSSAACLSAATQRWFSGVLLNDDTQAELVLANSDTVEAAVNAGIETLIASGLKPEQLPELVTGGGLATRFRAKTPTLLQTP